MVYKREQFNFRYFSNQFLFALDFAIILSIAGMKLNYHQWECEQEEEDGKKSNRVMEYVRARVRKIFNVVKIIKNCISAQTNHID